MTTYAAYALMLLVPVLLVLATFGLLMLLRDVPPVSSLVAPTAFALLTAVSAAAGPYMIMSLGLVFWARYRPAPAIRRAANLAPLILWLLVLLWLSGATWVSRGAEAPLPAPGTLLELFAWISALVLGIGYLWVMLAHALVGWLRRRGFVVDGA